MQKEFTSLGMMTGTSADGIDASVIISDGKSKLKILHNQFLNFEDKTSEEILNLKTRINNKKDLIKLSNSISLLEKKITLIHSNFAKEIINKFSPDLIGFHGQTIYHNALEKKSIQIGNAKLLSKFTKKNVIHSFRQNDLLNNGQGAPLAPIYHKLVAEKLNIDFPLIFLNIGGISNLTFLKSKNDENIFSSDIGPGNCMIDSWIRKNSKLKFDRGGKIAKNGKINEIIIEQVDSSFDRDILFKPKSLDTNDFDIAFARGLDLNDGAATITELTSRIISNYLNQLITEHKISQKCLIILCGGGRKNIFLIDSIKKKVSKKFELKDIDFYNFDGDYIESQAFAYLAIKSLLKLPFTFPKTTGCKKPCSGGVLIKY